MKSSACPPRGRAAQVAQRPTTPDCEIAVHVEGATVRYDGRALTAPVAPAARSAIAFQLRRLADVLAPRGRKGRN